MEILMERQKPLSKFAIVAIAGIAFALMTIVGNLHYASALTEEAMEKEARPKRVAEEYRMGYRVDFPERIQLSYPLRCEEQWISHQLPDGRWRMSCVVADLRSMK
jgi:hypothetical protein